MRSAIARARSSCWLMPALVETPSPRPSPASGRGRDPREREGEGFGIYVHWPFCLSKCPYCDFNSHVASAIDHAAWRKALLSELDHFGHETGGREVTSIFFGGGTPSLMEPATTEA